MPENGERYTLHGDGEDASHFHGKPEGRATSLPYGLLIMPRYSANVQLTSVH